MSSINKAQAISLSWLFSSSQQTEGNKQVDDYIDSFRKIMRRYKPMFEKIGLGHPDYTLYDELDKVKL